MLIKEENEGGGKAQSRESTGVIPQSSGGRFAQVRKVAHPKVTRLHQSTVCMSVKVFTLWT